MNQPVPCVRHPHRTAEIKEAHVTRRSGSELPDDREKESNSSDRRHLRAKSLSKIVGLPNKMSLVIGTSAAMPSRNDGPKEPGDMTSHLPVVSDLGSKPGASASKGKFKIYTYKHFNEVYPISYYMCI